MTIRIVRRPDNFFLEGTSRGLCLIVDCGKQLCLYNDDQELRRQDRELYGGFSEANDVGHLGSMIDRLSKAYGLWRRAVLKDEQFVARLASRLQEIRLVPEATRGSIVNICETFDKYQAEFSTVVKRPNDNPFPVVSLSKLLHFVRPVSFWILDSRVEGVLDLWGYSRSYRGFGKLLEDLFDDPEFEGLHAFLKQKDDSFCPFLKSLDKVLWYTSNTGDARKL